GTPGDLSGSVASLLPGGAVAGGGGEAPWLLPRLREGSAGARPCPPPAPAGEARAGVAGGACRAPTSRCFGGRSTPAADPVHSERSGNGSRRVPGRGYSGSRSDANDVLQQAESGWRRPGTVRPHRCGTGDDGAEVASCQGRLDSRVEGVQPGRQGTNT